MAKSSFEKALERHQRESKRLTDKQQREENRRMEDAARRERASSIVNGQPLIGNMRIMDIAAEEILKNILSNYDGNENRTVSGDDSCFPPAYCLSIKLEFEKLNMYGMISNPRVFVDGAWMLNLTPQGITYFEDKEKAMEKEKVIQQQSGINIGSIVATGSNVVLGNMINSSVLIYNSIQRIEHEIDEKGGEDAEELHELLDEIKELVENIQDSRHVPKNKGLFSKLSNHLEKHGWFYGEAVGLLGTAVLQLLQG